MTRPRLAGTLPVGKVASRECARATRCLRVHQKLEILATHGVTRLTTELRAGTLAVSDVLHEFHRSYPLGAAANRADTRQAPAFEAGAITREGSKQPPRTR